MLNARTKHVLSNTLAEPLPWQNSNVLAGDPTTAIRDLKASSGPRLVLLGSGMLLRTLLTSDLVDEMVLLVHPLVLGSGWLVHHHRSSLRPGGVCRRTR